MDKVGSYEFLAEPFHCDFSGRLFMGHLGNHMLNAADFHSSARGFGMKYLMTINRSWVLSRLAIEMTEMPQQYTKFNVETWVESAMRYFTSRNFSVIGNDGHTYGYGRSIWAMIDTESRQPTDIYDIDDVDEDFKIGFDTDYIIVYVACIALIWTVPSLCAPSIPIIMMSISTDTSTP